MRQGEHRIVGFVKEEILPLTTLPKAAVPAPICVVIVTHALLSKCLLRNLLQLGDTAITWRHDLKETGVCEFKLEDGLWSLERWNDTGHLVSPRDSLEDALSDSGEEL